MFLYVPISFFGLHLFIPSNSLHLIYNMTNFKVGWDSWPRSLEKPVNFKREHVSDVMDGISGFQLAKRRALEISGLTGFTGTYQPNTHQECSFLSWWITVIGFWFCIVMLMRSSIIDFLSCSEDCDYCRDGMMEWNVIISVIGQS